jgi:hypothetical protein
MDRGPLTERIIQTFDDMPAQLQAGARYVLDRPRDVALLSMREQARQAGVQPATMTRLAKRLGMDGYDEVRELYAAAVRDGGLGFAGFGAANLLLGPTIEPFGRLASSLCAHAGRRPFGPYRRHRRHGFRSLGARDGQGRAAGRKRDALYAPDH